MVRTPRERALIASRAAAAAKRRRRFQKVIAEMRADGLVVDVWRDRDGGGSELHPDYRAGAVPAAAGR